MIAFMNTVSLSSFGSAWARYLNFMIVGFRSVYPRHTRQDFPSYAIYFCVFYSQICPVEICISVSATEN